ncbi:MAG: hypothetical protein ACI9MC_000385 [Kiritimatiellia bacterium]|jgi:hypothetical protein
MDVSSRQDPYHRRTKGHRSVEVMSPCVTLAVGPTSARVGRVADMVDRWSWRCVCTNTSGFQALPSQTVFGCRWFDLVALDAVVVGGLAAATVAVSGWLWALLVDPDLVLGWLAGPTGWELTDSAGLRALQWTGGAVLVMLGFATGLAVSFFSSV